MIVGLRNFGCLKEVSIELAPLTILCGANNTGKTYAMYAIYGLLKQQTRPRRLHSDELLGIELTNTNGATIALDDYYRRYWSRLHQRIAQRFRGSLSYFFSTEQEVFAESQVTLESDLSEALPAIHAAVIKERFQFADDKSLLEISKEADSLELTITRVGNIPEGLLADWVMSALRHLLMQPWSGDNQVLLPAERAGLNLFYPELNTRRTALFHQAGKPEVDLAALLKDLTIARYPQPIADYIDLLNEMRTLKKHKSEFHEMALALQKEVLGGNFSVDRDATISFKPRRSRQTLGLHLSSSTAKTYFGLWFYLEHLARPSDVLMIDEPELNLHPDNQRRIARLLARLVRMGHRIIVSTHSDYFVREINNLILLGHEFQGRDELREKFHYEPEDQLSAEQVRAYIFHDGTATPMEMSPDEGIIAETFDKVINEMNVSSYELVDAWAMARTSIKSNEEDAA
ncbi:MAG: ATP-binding protein, partial [Armatimonadota bacterium]|nr:ATP-binding protein [Armatimonadota bacterium]